LSQKYLKRLEDPLLAEILLWLIDLDAYAATLTLCGFDGLDAMYSEQAVQARHARRSFASGHVLKRVIADALDRSPDDIEIQHDRFGKPHLSDRAVHFNLSHSGPYALIGVHRDSAIGVDLEVLRPAPDTPAIVVDQFTADEQRAWHDAGTAGRDSVFFCCWTRKEAVVKSLGTGFLIAPSQIEAGCSADARQVAVALGRNQCEVAVASMFPLRNAVASVAIATPDAITLARDFAEPPVQGIDNPG
jgi:4'-phosphopantetheinyl transferase